MLKPIIRLAYIVTVFIESLIIARIGLTIINANTENNLAGWIMSTSSVFVDPFNGIITSSIKINDFSLSLTPLVALVFYIIAGFVLSELLKSFSRD